MTQEPIRSVVGMDDDEVRTLNLLLEQLDDRMPRNQLRTQVYDGKRALRQISSVVPGQYYHLGLTLGWVAKGIDSLARRCTLDRFVWDGGDLDSLGAREVFDQNYLRSETNSGVTSSLMHAVSFVVNVAGEDGEPDSLMLYRDALSATGTWNARRRALDDFVSVTEREDDRPVAVVLYLNGVTISADKSSGAWRVSERSEHPWGVPVEVLPYRPRLGRPFGSSRMTRAAMSAQDAGLREVIRLEGHMDVFSFPELLLLGADGAVFKDASGNTINSWAQMMGRIKGIPDDDEAENPRATAMQIPASSPEPHLAALNTHAKTCAREMSLPDNALALTDVANPTSAESYDAAQYELISEAQGATDDWSTPLRRSFIRALAIQNGLREVPEEWTSIDAKWRNPQYLTRAAEADAGAKQLGSGPEWLKETEVGLELLGMTDDQVRRALSEKRRLDGGRLLDRVLTAREQGAAPDGVTPDADAV